MFSAWFADTFLYGCLYRNEQECRNWQPRSEGDVPVPAHGGENRLVNRAQDASPASSHSLWALFQGSKYVSSHVSMPLQLVVFVEAVMALNSGQFLSATTIVAAFIPLCGWAGARSRNPSMLRSFVLCNTVCACIGVLVLIINLAVSLPAASCICDDACFIREYEPGDRSSAASQQMWSTREVLCSPGRDTLITDIWISSALTFAACMLQAVGVQSGRKLSDAILMVEPLQSDIPVAPVMMRPGEPSQPQAVSRRFVQPLDSTHAPPYLQDARHDHTGDRGGAGGAGGDTWTPSDAWSMGSRAGGDSGGREPPGVSHDASGLHSGSSLAVTWSGARTAGHDLAVPRSAASTGSGGFSFHTVQTDRTSGRPATGVGV